MNRRRAFAAGVIVVGLYLAGWFWSASLDPFNARPVLDGLGPPPAYRWVSPPPSLSSTNKPPFPGQWTLRIEEEGSRGVVLSTKDYQLSLVLGGGAFAQHRADTTVSITVRPLAPEAGAQMPDGTQIVGNVYRITATYEPSGSPIQGLDGGAQIYLVYPVLYPPGSNTRAMYSPDGVTWMSIQSTNHPGQQSVVAPLTRTGSFAAGQETPPPRTASERRPTTTFLLLLAAGVLLAITLVVVVRARLHNRDRA